MRMAASFLGLTEEQQRSYLLKAPAAASAQQEIAGIGKVAKRAAIAWRSHRGLGACQPKRESQDDKGSAPAQEIPRSCAVPTLGRRETMDAIGYLAMWC